MNYSVDWTNKATHILKKLPQDVAMRIWDKIENIKENPFRCLKHFEGGGYKFRVGDYRALIDVDFTRKVLVVRVLDKRSRIYKR
ncbi:MAG: type II toxin-antitoxin system RelE/ParE family toxin [Pseudomonadota bacterium]